MPGEYLKGFPNPENSPNEKFLVPGAPELWEDDLFSDLVSEGMDRQAARAVARAMSRHEERKKVSEDHRLRELEYWANIHTHQGGGAGGGGGLSASENIFAVDTNRKHIDKYQVTGGVLTSSPDLTTSDNARQVLYAMGRIYVGSPVAGEGPWILDAETMAELWDQPINTRPGGYDVRSDGGVIIASSESGQPVYHYDRDGTLVDQFDNPSINVKVAVDASNNFFIRGRDTLYAFEDFSGTPIWTRTSLTGYSDSNRGGCIEVCDGFLLDIMEDEITLFDANDGSTAWQKTEAGLDPYAPGATAPNKLLVGRSGVDRSVVCYDLDGTSLWDINLDSVTATGRVISLAVDPSGQVFVHVGDSVATLDLATGAIVDSFAHDGIADGLTSTQHRSICADPGKYGAGLWL